MKVFFRTVLLVTTLVFLLTACKKSEATADPIALINPADANALAKSLVLPDGAQSITGVPPAAGSDNLVPPISSPFTQVISSNGGTTPLPYNFQNVCGNTAGFYVQVTEADAYFNLAYSGTAGGNDQVQLSVTIPANVAAISKSGTNYNF